MQSKAFALAFFLLVFTGFSAAQNLLANPSFESGQAPWLYFHNPSNATATEQVVSENCRSGNCLKMVLGNALSQTTRQELGSLAAGDYNYSAWFNTPPSKFAYIYVSDLDWKNSTCQKKIKTIVSDKFNGTGQWIKIDMTFAVPAVDECGESTTAHKWRAVVIDSPPDASGTPVYFDDLSLEKIVNETPYCGNFVCDPGENTNSCSQDCWPISTYGWYNTQQWIDKLPITHLRTNFVTLDEQTVRSVLQASQAKSLFVKMQYGTSSFTPQNKVDYENYARQVSALSVAVPEIYSFSIDDFNGYWSRSNFDSVHLDRLVAASKSANPKVKFSITAYEDDFTENKYANMPEQTRRKIDIVILGLHFRKSGTNYAQYVAQAKQAFPNARVIALAYAYDRIDYTGCDSLNGVKCTKSQELELFAQAMDAQAKLLASGDIAGIEFYPDAFGYEDDERFIKWGTAQACQGVSRCQVCNDKNRCVQVTQTMRERAKQIFCENREDCAQAFPDQLSARDPGFYGGATWPTSPPNGNNQEFYSRVQPLVFTIRNSVRVDENNWKCDSQATKDRLALVKSEIDKGYDLVPRRRMLLEIYFWDNSSEQNGYNYPLKDKGVYQARIDCALEKLNDSVSKLYGVSLAEEQDPQNSMRAKMLDDLYKGTKAKYPGLQIYQWYLYSFNPANPLRIRTPETYEGTYVSADGWLFDFLRLSPRSCPDQACHLTDNPYLNTMQKYALAGKPIVSEIWAATTRPDYWTSDQDMWSTMDEQFSVNTAFNVPTAFYWYSCAKNVGQPCTGLANTPYFTTDSNFFPNQTLLQQQIAMNAKVNQLINQSQALPTGFSGYPTQQSWTGNVISIPCDNGIPVYFDSFSGNTLVDKTSGTGLRQLVWKPGSLSARSVSGSPVSASITYAFTCREQYSGARAKISFSLSKDAKAKLEISSDGQHWNSAEATSGSELAVSLGGSGQSVYVKTTLSSPDADSETNAVTLHSLELSQGSSLQLPDLSISGEDASGALGQNVSVNVNVRNSGDEASFTSTARIGSSDFEIPSLLPGQSYQITNAKVTCVTSGQNSVELQADANNDVAESDEDNNGGILSLSCSGGEKPNLVSAINPSFLSVAIQDSAQLTATVTNVGSQDSPQSQLRVLVDGVEQLFNVPALSYGQSAEFGIAVACNSLGSHQIASYADFAMQVNESNEDDNANAAVIECVSITASPSPGGGGSTGGSSGSSGGFEQGLGSGKENAEQAIKKASGITDFAKTFLGKTKGADSLDKSKDSFSKGDYEAAVNLAVQAGKESWADIMDGLPLIAGGIVLLALGLYALIRFAKPPQAS